MSEKNKSVVGWAVLFSILSLAMAPIEPAQAEVGPKSSQSSLPFCSGQLVQSFPIETSLEVPGLAKTEAVWLELIKKAKVSIDIAGFYLSSEGKKKGSKSDAPMEAILAELENAGNRGVKIRVLLSSALIMEDPGTLGRVSAIKNVRIAVLDLSKITGGFHHAKYWVVDRNRVFLGSQNLDWRSLRHIGELGVCLEDSELASRLNRLFDLDWKLAKDRQVPGFNGSAVLFSPRAVELVASPPSLTPPEIRPALNTLIETIENTNHTLQIQLMEYSPVSGKTYWPELDNAIRGAALRGVQIQMIVPDMNLKGLSGDYLRSLAALPGIQVKTLTIPKWSGGEVPFGRLIRSKYMISDGIRLFIGNSNWTKGYFYNSGRVPTVRLLSRERLLRRQNSISKGPQNPGVHFFGQGLVQS
ncbi:MAG: hypothetical protein HYX67_07520 [Candidatus Melainabacteria bacterium]|nr:hypothetical protein [Candidatus Melainabacteria bacterium]